MNKVKVKIYGDVQTVGFRNFIYNLAKKLELKGWVKNCDDKTVEAVFEGEKQAVKQMLEFCKQGPTNAFVKNIEIQPDNLEEKLEDFKILL